MPSSSVIIAVIMIAIFLAISVLTKFYPQIFSTNQVTTGEIGSNKDIKSLLRAEFDILYVWPKVRANPPDPLGRDFHFFITQRVTISEVVSGEEVKLRPVVTMFAQDQWRLPDYPPEYQILPNAIYMFVNAEGDVRAWSNVGYSPPHLDLANPISYSCPISKLTENPLRIYLDGKLVGEYPFGEARRTYSLSPCYPTTGENIHEWGGVSAEAPANAPTGTSNAVFESILANRLSLTEPDDNNLHIAVLKLKPFLAYTSPEGSAVYVMNSNADPRFQAGNREDQVYFDTHSAVKFTSSSSGVKIEATGSIGWPLEIILDGATVLKCARYENAYWSSTTTPQTTSSTTTTTSQTTATTQSTTTATTQSTTTTIPMTSTRTSTPLTTSSITTTPQTASTASTTSITSTTTSSTITTKSTTTTITPPAQPCRTYDIPCWIGYFILRIFGLAK